MVRSYDRKIGLNFHLLLLLRNAIGHSHTVASSSSTNQPLMPVLSLLRKEPGDNTHLYAEQVQQYNNNYILIGPKPGNKRSVQEDKRGYSKPPILLQNVAENATYALS